MEYKNYTLAELKSYIDSGQYLASDIIAITPIRAYSQLQNPKASPTDIVLTIAFLNRNEIVGYIGALPDKVNNIKCAWNSCWWVKPGTPAEVSMKLFFLFVSNWEKNVLFSEMTPHTAKMIEQMRFCKCTTTIGFRAYYRFSLNKVLPAKKKVFGKIKGLLYGIDQVLNSMIALRNFMHKNKNASNLKVETISELGELDDRFIDRFNQDNLAKRYSTDFNWIQQNTWLNTSPNYDKEIAQRYFFSYYTPQFESKWLRFYQNDTLVGLVNYTIRNGALKLPYVYCDASFAVPIANYFIQLLKKNSRLSTITTFHYLLVEAFMNQRCKFIYHVRLPKYSAISTQLFTQTTIDNPEFQMGDGDAVFT